MKSEPIVSIPQLADLLMATAPDQVVAELEARAAKAAEEASEYFAVGAAKEREAQVLRTWAQALKQTPSATSETAPLAGEVASQPLVFVRGGHGSSPAQDELVEYMRKQNGKKVSFEQAAKDLKRELDIVAQTARRTEEAFKKNKRDEGVTRLGQGIMQYVRRVVETGARAAG